MSGHFLNLPRLSSCSTRIRDLLKIHKDSYKKTSYQINKHHVLLQNYLIVVGQFVCLNELYVSWSLVLLVGPPMLKRLKGRDLTKSDPLVLQVGGLPVGLMTLHHKKH